MYESPIQRIVSDIQTQMQEDEEKQLMATIMQKVGYEVDRDELIKALQYDREQYDKGYADGKRDAQKHGHWVMRGYCIDHKTKHRKADKWTLWQCSVCGENNGRFKSDKFCRHCGAKMDEVTE